MADRLYEWMAREEEKQRAREEAERAKREATERAQREAAERAHKAGVLRAARERAEQERQALHVRGGPWRCSVYVCVGEVGQLMKLL